MFRKEPANSPSRYRAMSLVPPTIRQSRKTVRPVLALYHSRNPTLNSWRMASLWGVMMTTVSSASSGEAWRGRRMKGSATVATRARMMIPRLTMGSAQPVRTTTSSARALA